MSNIKKVCIVTLYGNFNLGNRLQNYAVQEKCIELGCKVKSIKTYVVNEKSNKIRNYVARIKHCIFYKKLFVNKKFLEFKRKHLILDNFEVFTNENNKRLNKKYDYFIVGSDQVWNPDFGLKGDITFLEFANKNRIAFSASIGVDEIPKDKMELYRRGLNKLDYISVREDKAKELVQNLTDRDNVEVLVDPTMLLSKSEWQKISKKPDNFNEKKYILTYFLGKVSENIRKDLEKYAKYNNLKIIDVMENGKPKNWIGPSEFVYLEEHAELICTDSFHSCVFGILMETPFIVFDRVDKHKNMNSRIETLLTKFNLENRKYDGVLYEEILKCDFSNCKEILKIEREKSKKFLIKALEIE